MESTRLPGKTMMVIDDRNSLLDYVIKQVMSSKVSKNIVIATTTSKKDEIIVDYAIKNGLNYFQGDPFNVLDRYYQCSKKFSISPIVRISADDPLVDPNIINAVIEKFLLNSFDYVSNVHPRTFPQGNEVEVFSFEALENAWKLAKKQSEKEHVTPFIYNNRDLFRISNVEHSENLSTFRWTVDRQDDLDLVRSLVSKIQKRPILMTDILDVLSKEPDLLKINKNHIMDEGYLKSVNNDN